MIIHGLDKIHIRRHPTGVARIDAFQMTDLLKGMGFCHAMDRGLQLLMMRILGRGEASQYLNSSDDVLAIDLFFRRMNWKGHTTKEIDKIPPTERALLQAYCDGINLGFSRKIPWELKLFHYTPDLWKIEDSILISRMIGYLTLSQSQAEMERLLLEMVQANIDRKKIDELFPGILSELDEDLIRKVKLGERIVPNEFLWGQVPPRMMASNNWVISGEKTKSGRPLLANDPHLEGNRLPNVWYELILSQKGRYGMGATMPGLPALLIGRTPDLSWGATYSFMDTVDSWVEQCKDDKYLKNGAWHFFRRRQEIIRRKGKASVVKTFFENEHGVLDGDPTEEGYYLTTRWSCAESGGESLAQALGMWNARSVSEGMERLGKVETPWNWVLADREGNIGYQMSGLKPKRRKGISGFIPLPGWKDENDWQGFENYEDLPRSLNPACEYIVTANQNLNHFGNVDPINMPMGDYRSQQIERLIRKATDITVSDVKEMQQDLYSIQAENFLKEMKPFLPDTPQGRIMKEWDCRYFLNSKGAYLFEKIYRALFHSVFGENGFGERVFKFLEKETSTFADFYACFDRILLSKSSEGLPLGEMPPVWFGGKTREEIYRAAIEKGLGGEMRKRGKRWKSRQKIYLSHILFNGKLPRFFGFDRGPVWVSGGRATVSQGQIYRNAGRLTSFVPSFRFITDFSSDEAHTSLMGGPSDRRFSKWYCSELKEWRRGKYKVLSLDKKKSVEKQF